MINLAVVHLELEPHKVGQNRGSPRLGSDRRYLLARGRAHDRETGGSGQRGVEGLEGLGGKQMLGALTGRCGGLARRS